MTEPYKIIEVKESVFADNDREAARLRTQLKQDRTFLLNLMSSPGSGKTTTLLRTLEALKDELRIGVMEADIDSDVDAKIIADAGVKSIQLHTGGMCHLDASMTEQGLKEIGTKDLDLVVLENVGNLVCPAEFDTGAVKNAMILSVPEGHDKPLKYPLIFTVCDALLAIPFVLELFSFSSRIDALHHRLAVAYAFLVSAAFFAVTAAQLICLLDGRARGWALAFWVSAPLVVLPMAAVNTVGTLTFFRPFAARRRPMASVQSSSWRRVRCGQPMKQSCGRALGFFHITG